MYTIHLNHLHQSKISLESLYCKKNKKQNLWAGHRTIKQSTLTKKTMMTLLQLSFYCVTDSSTELVQTEFTNRELKRELATQFRKKHKPNNGHIECLEGLYSLEKDFITKTHTSTFMPVNWFSLKKLIFTYQPSGERQIKPINSPL